MLLSIHIAAGGLAFVLGAVALSVKKGGAIHRRGGLPFVCAMLVLGTSAATLGVLKTNRLTDQNVFSSVVRGDALTPHSPRAMAESGVSHSSK